MIEARRLSKSFDRITALKEVSFNVQPGEAFALLGPNGSGKTTLLKCLAGLVRPTSGDIHIHGFNLARQSIAARHTFSYLPQRVAFPEQMTAREVLEFYRRLRNLEPERLEAALGQSLLQDSADRLVSEFSGGMLQRLGIAVALLPDAPILLLDEPTASLDPEAAADLRALLTLLKERGKTILFSSHVLSDVDRLADRVVILLGGRLRAIGTVATLRNELGSQCRLHVQLANPQKRFCSIANAAGATGVYFSTGGLSMSASPAIRYNVLRALDEAGAEITNFSTFEPALEDIYMRYIHENPADLPGADGLCELRVPAAAAR